MKNIMQELPENWRYTVALEARQSGSVGVRELRDFWLGVLDEARVRLSAGRNSRRVEEQYATAVAEVRTVCSAELSGALGWRIAARTAVAR